MKNGFSLVELMIVVAIIGILAVVALPAYNNYITDTNTTKVGSAFESAARGVEARLVRVRGQAAIGFPVDFANDDGWAVADWVVFLNGDGGLAPSGDPQFVAGAVDEAYNDSGQIAVAVTAGTGSAYGVTLVRPAYGNYEAVNSRTITYGDSD